MYTVSKAIGKEQADFLKYFAEKTLFSDEYQGWIAQSDDSLLCIAFPDESTLSFIYEGPTIRVQYTLNPMRPQGKRDIFIFKNFLR